MFGRGLIAALSLLVLVSCQQWRLPTSAGWVALDGGYFQLLDSWPGKPQQRVQQISWQDGQKQHQFLLTILLQPDGYLLVALSPLGQELWRLQYNRGHHMTLSGVAPFNQPDFARRLLAEMQLALLDEAVVAARLNKLWLKQHENKRVIHRQDGSMLLQIEPAGSMSMAQDVVIEASQYQLTISTIQQDFL